MHRREWCGLLLLTSVCLVRVTPRSCTLAMAYEQCTWHTWYILWLFVGLMHMLRFCFVLFLFQCLKKRVIIRRYLVAFSRRDRRRACELSRIILHTYLCTLSYLRYTWYVYFCVSPLIGRSSFRGGYDYAGVFHWVFMFQYYCRLTWYSNWYVTAVWYIYTQS